MYLEVLYKFHGEYTDSILELPFAIDIFSVHTLCLLWFVF